MSYEHWRKLIQEAFKGLEKAVKELMADTTPQTPMPRSREFVFAPRVTWPRYESVGGSTRHRRVLWLSIDAGNEVHYGLEYSNSRDKVASIIYNRCGRQPRRVLQAIRRIQAAIAWCEARAEGRRRAAEEILRQQAKAVEALEAEAAMAALK